MNPPNYLRPDNPNALGENSNALFGLPVKNQYGQFQVGGNLAGNEGFLDALYNVVPGVGDYRGALNLVEAGRPKLTPDLMGGAKVGITDPTTVAFESAALAPVMGDIATAVKATGATFGPLIALMAKRNDALFGLADAPMARGMQGLIGYHGSPHKFAPEPGYPLGRFKHEMMGSGEGAQAYGWGTYIAENPDTAKTYAGAGSALDIDPADGYSAIEDVLSNRMSQMQDVGRYDEAAALEELLINRSAPKARARFADNPAALREIDQHADKFIESNLYEVDLPDEQIAKMLDWDAPIGGEEARRIEKNLRETLDIRPVKINDRDYGLTLVGDDGSGRVMDFVGVAGKSPKETETAISRAIMGMHGDSVYRDLSRLLGSDEAASDVLNKSGIPGIKYWDGGSRSAGTGTRNFVVFDEDIMSILKRNDEALPVDEASRMADEYDRLVAARRKAFSKKTTGIPTYDNMIKNPEYFRRAKGIDANMVELTPQQYLDKAAAGGRGNKGPEIDMETVKKYAEKIRNGEQFPALTLDYSSGKLSQEGRHRSLAAIEVGIDRVPVLEVRRID